jgi:hypothetical protein
MSGCRTAWRGIRDKAALHFVQHDKLDFWDSLDIFRKAN